MIRHVNAYFGSALVGDIMYSDTILSLNPRCELFEKIHLVRQFPPFFLQNFIVFMACCFFRHENSMT